MPGIRYCFDEEKIINLKNKNKANPQAIGESLEQIAEKTGALTPGAVVDAARSPRSVLHRHFEWDDQKAAEQHRLMQARDLIASIHVEHEATDNGLARAFLSVRDEEGVRYRRLSDILASADLQARVLEAAERDLQAFEERFRNLHDVCVLVREAREKVAAHRRAKKETRAQT